MIIDKNYFKGKYIQKFLCIGWGIVKEIPRIDDNTENHGRNV
jgi:hypothetical protein